MSNIISINEKLIKNAIDETYDFFDNITISFNVDNNVYYDEYYVFCKNIFDFMNKNNINNNFYEVIDLVISSAICDIIVSKEKVDIKNVIHYSTLYLNIAFYRFSTNPIKNLKIMNLKEKMIEDVMKLPKNKVKQFKKR